MRVFMAGLFASGWHRGSNMYQRMLDIEKETHATYPNLLESYHYLCNPRKLQTFRADPGGRKMFLDSGAFSAFTKGVEIDIVKFCDYIKENQDVIEVVSVLDGIGDPKKTLENQNRMHDLGVDALPCFHYGEPEEYLDYYVENYEYITLGGMVPVSTPQLKLWLDRIWKDHLTNPDGTAKIRVHGFGLTVVDLMKRYPWYSVDSSSWVQIASNGGILHSENFKVISISKDSPNRKVENQHWSTLAPLIQSHIKDYVDGEGFDFDRMTHEFTSRWAYNCYSFHKLQEVVNSAGTPVLKIEQQRLF